MLLPCTGDNVRQSRMQNLSFLFFQQPSPLWQSAITLRYEVFVFEQKVPEEMEVDAYDETAHHLLVWDSHQNSVGTLRILVQGRTGKIGRVAVAPSYRRQGIGTMMMLKSLAYCCAMRLESVTLDSQSYITPFYEHLGFVEEGGPFLDAGIPHIRMTRVIGS